MYKTNIIAREFDLKEKKQAHVLKKSKLIIPFQEQDFSLEYALTRYDINNGILSIPYSIQTKRSEDGIEERFFKKYYDIILAEVLTDEQLVRKRKMQLELSQEISQKSKTGILNSMLKRRILFPFIFQRYWMKWTLEHFDMGWVQSAEKIQITPEPLVPAQRIVNPLSAQIDPPPALVADPVPVLPTRAAPIVAPTTQTLEAVPIMKISGVLHISIKHFFRDMLRFNYLSILTLPQTPQNQKKKTNDYFFEMQYKLPNLFVRFNEGRTKEEIVRFIIEDFAGLERYRHFWHFQMRNLFGKVFIDPIVEWSGNKTIKLTVLDTLSKAKQVFNSKLKTLGTVAFIVQTSRELKQKKKKKKK